MNASKKLSHTRSITIAIGILAFSTGCNFSPSYTPKFLTPTDGEHLTAGTIYVSGKLVLSLTPDQQKQAEAEIAKGTKGDLSIFDPAGKTFINGQEVKKDGFGFEYFSFPLKPGANKITARYEGKFSSRETSITVYYDTSNLAAAFVGTPTSGTAPLLTSFDASASTGGIVSYAWAFGDGQTSTSANKIVGHTYVNAGSYSVTLTVRDSGGFTATTSHAVTVRQSPVASFTASPQTGVAPLLVTLDASASSYLHGTISSYSWNFGDGQSQVTTNKSVTHNYGTPGSYTAVLTVKDSDGDTSQVSKVISARALPIASFTTSPASGVAPLTVNLDASASIYLNGTIASYGWSFGDGQSLVTAGKTITHAYLLPGSYTASLTVTDSDGDSASFQRVILVRSLPTSSFTATPQSGFAPLSVVLDASSSSYAGGTITSYGWNFGDGQTSMTTAKSVTHIFTSAGSYTVVLTVKDSDGDSATSQSVITVNILLVSTVVPNLCARCAGLEMVSSFRYPQASHPDPGPAQLPGVGDSV